MGDVSLPEVYLGEGSDEGTVIKNRTSMVYSDKVRNMRFRIVTVRLEAFCFEFILGKNNIGREMHWEKYLM